MLSVMNDYANTRMVGSISSNATSLYQMNTPHSLYFRSFRASKSRFTWAKHRVDALKLLTQKTFIGRKKEKCISSIAETPFHHFEYAECVAVSNASTALRKKLLTDRKQFSIEECQLSSKPTSILENEAHHHCRQSNVIIPVSI